jgi:hypothetical protein
MAQGGFARGAGRGGHCLIRFGFAHYQPVLRLLMRRSGMKWTDDAGPHDTGPDDTSDALHDPQVLALRRSGAGCRRRLGRARRRAGRREVETWRLGNALRNAGWRVARAMRAGPVDRRRGQAQRQPRGHRAEDRGRQGRLVLASRSTMPTSAAPASCAACRRAASPKW